MSDTDRALRPGADVSQNDAADSEARDVPGAESDVRRIERPAGGGVVAARSPTEPGVERPPAGSGVVQVQPTEPSAGAEPPAESTPEPSAGLQSDDDEDDAEALVGQVLADRYRIEKLLGSGGMGAVYQAQHIHMRKSVAIKVLHREMTYLPEVVARFEREAIAAARIEHPNVAAATDFGKLDDGTFYLVLEFVDGESLTKRIERRGRLPVTDALKIARQMADALSAAHAAGIVHRDLKPDNVMLLEREGDDSFVKVLDFGIAKVTVDDSAQKLTQLGSVFGTPEYMAPEQAKGQAVDHRADLYTVGLILYEMLSGQTPFGDDDLVVILTRQMTEPPPPLPADIDPNVAALVMRLLEKEPDARPQSADELMAAFDQLLGVSVTPSPVSVAQPSTPYGDTVLSMPRPSVSLPESPQRASQVMIEARTALDSVLGEVQSRAPALTRKVRIGNVALPTWVLAAGGGFGLLVLAFAVTLLVASGDDGQPSSSEKEEPSLLERLTGPSKEVRELMGKAETGDRDAIAKLQALPGDEQSPEVLRALAQGLGAIGHYPAMLQAYSSVLEEEPDLAKSDQVARDVRLAADSAEHYEAALKFAVDKLGQRGVDVLYDVAHPSKKRKTPKQASKAAKELLEQADVRAKASPAMLVALDLKEAKGCASYKEVLPRAAEHADERSYKTLRKLTYRKGCGFLGLGDCYSCLRRESSLSDAVKRAKDTPGPSFAADGSADETDDDSTGR